MTLSEGWELCVFPEVSYIIMEPVAMKLSLSRNNYIFFFKSGYLIYFMQLLYSEGRDKKMNNFADLEFRKKEFRPHY